GGLRSRKSRFLPGHLASPGGKLEPVDGPGRPGALARCATREVREETGVAVPAERWLDAGERTTPPFFTVRFRTRFFVAEMPRGARLPDVPPSPGEIEEIAFASPRRTLAVWAAGRSSVPPPLL